MRASDAYRVWWAAGAILIALLVVDVFVYVGSAVPSLESPLAWFVLGLLTIVFLGATIALRPRTSKTR